MAECETMRNMSETFASPFLLLLDLSSEGSVSSPADPSRSTLLIMGLPDICAHFEPFFLLTDDRLQALVKQFREELEAGLDEYGKDVAMVPSFVMGVPDGNEQG